MGTSAWRWSARASTAVRDAGVLARRLRDVPGVAAVAAARGHEVPDLLASERTFRDRTRGDFAAGRVIRVDGWMIAQAEVLLILALADV